MREIRASHRHLSCRSLVLRSTYPVGEKSPLQSKSLSGKATVRPRYSVLMPEVEPSTSRQLAVTPTGSLRKLTPRKGLKPSLPRAPSRLYCAPLCVDGNLRVVMASRVWVAAWQASDLAGVHSSLPCAVASRSRTQPGSYFKAMPREN